MCIGGRTVRAGHRRTGLATAGRGCRPPVLPQGADHVEGHADRGRHRRRPGYPRALEELMPSARHYVERWANNRIETDHSRLKHRLRPMRGLRTDRTAKVIIAGLAFVQNLPGGHYELGVDVPRSLWMIAAFEVLAQ